MRGTGELHGVRARPPLRILLPVVEYMQSVQQRSFSDLLSTGGQLPEHTTYTMRYRRSQRDRISSKSGAYHRPGNRTATMWRQLLS